MKGLPLVALDPGDNMFPLGAWRPVIIPAGWNQIGASAWRHTSGLKVIATVARENDGQRWAHISCSYADRLPSWGDLVNVKEIFLGRDALALQVLPPRDEWINQHPYTLHLFCCLDGRPTPDFRHGGSL